ncbi:MAG: hypothetical protein HXY34_01425 [Candidatus Thorarchaeota archaeon]|nr:hypothetical protein [Candidatus Thorarchaeota archaeon]
MISKQASFRTLMDDIKISIRFAVKNLITFLLGMVGVLIVTGLLMGLVFGLIMLLLSVLIGFDAIVTFFMSLGVLLADSNALAALPLVGLFVLPMLSPLFIALGALYGIGREIVESAGATAEGAFVWYRSKFLSLAGGGIIIALFILGPLLVGFWLVLLLAGPVLSVSSQAILTAVTVAWILLAPGLVSMVFPAIIDGHSVVSAVKTSLRMSRDHFDRVLSTWLSFVLMALVILAPTTVSQTILLSGFVDALPWTALLGGAAAIFTFTVLLPSLIIAQTRVYMILSGEDVPLESQETLPDMRLVGGV